MTVTTPIGDARRPCRFCGRLQRPRGHALHERRCPQNPQHAAPALPPAPPLPAPIRRPPPPLSGPSALVLSLLQTRPDDPEVRQSLRRRYLVCRARDFGILLEA
jgi:hypothetical protein